MERNLVDLVDDLEDICRLGASVDAVSGMDCPAWSGWHSYGELILSLKRKSLWSMLTKLEEDRMVGGSIIACGVGGGGLLAEFLAQVRDIMSSKDEDCVRLIRAESLRGCLDVLFLPTCKRLLD